MHMYERIHEICTIPLDGIEIHGALWIIEAMLPIWQNTHRQDKTEQTTVAQKPSEPIYHAAAAAAARKARRDECGGLT